MKQQAAIAVKERCRY